MTNPCLSLSNTDSSWHPILREALGQMDPDYLRALADDPTWLPGAEHCLKAFSLPLPKLRAILFGESPYPRQESANGYAFWDGAVHNLWSATGFSKAVNRATSLRNFLKMLLVAEKALDPEDLSQNAIAMLPKDSYVQTLDELFQHLLDHGILLLNTSLALSKRPVTQEAKKWQPFVLTILSQLQLQKPETELLLFGRIAANLQEHRELTEFSKLVAEHPYNLSFIHNPQVLAYFTPLHLLRR